MRETVDTLVDGFERGRLSRRELVAGLLALGATGTVAREGAAAQSGAAPPPIATSGIDHIALRVSDVDRSARFYADHLGATVRSRSSGSVFLDVGSQWLALFGPGVASTSFGVTAPGLDHISFQPVSARSLEDRTRVLREHGLEPRNPPGSGRVYFKDPDGLILQLS
jgi:metallothiol transferase